MLGFHEFLGSCRDVRVNPEGSSAKVMSPLNRYLAPSNRDEMNCRKVYRTALATDCQCSCCDRCSATKRGEDIAKGLSRWSKLDCAEKENRVIHGCVGEYCAETPNSVSSTLQRLKAGVNGGALYGQLRVDRISIQGESGKPSRYRSLKRICESAASTDVHVEEELHLLSVGLL